MILFERTGKWKSGGVPTFFRDKIDHSILIDESHPLSASLAHAGHDVATSDTTLPAGGGVEKRALEVCVELRVEFPIVVEDNPDRLVGINYAKLQIGSKGVLDEVSVVGRDLETIRATDLHQGLVARLASDGMLDLLGQLEIVALGLEAGVVKGLPTRRCGDMADRRNVQITATGSGEEEVNADAALHHALRGLSPSWVLGGEQFPLVVGVVDLAVVS